MKAIFLCDSAQLINEVYDDSSIERLKNIVDFDDQIWSRKELISGEKDLHDVEYVFSTWTMPSLSAEEIKKYLPNLKAVFYAAGTVQGFARPFLHCGVSVFSAWAANAVPVAEYTVAQIILANKGFFRSSRLASEGKRGEAYNVFKKYYGNYNTKIGIIGAGMIGKKVIEMLKNYQVDIMVFDPFLADEDALELGASKVSLETLFESCNVVSNHLANNAKTKGMLDYRLFSLLQPNATFLNTGRGAQVVERDLCKILSERPDLTAVLDVTDPEPPALDSMFYQLDNCILTPHIAGSSGYEVRRMAVYMIDEFGNYLNNKPTQYVVTEKMLETMA